MPLEHLLAFTVITTSRHPLPKNAYSKALHAYAHEYINPSIGPGWTLVCDAGAHLETETIVLEPHAGGQDVIADGPDGPAGTGSAGPSHGHIGAGHPTIITKPKIPEEVAGYVWRIDGIGSTFSKTVERPRTTNRRWNPTVAHFDVPATGKYQITLQIKTNAGATLSKSQEFNLRDILLVTVGDSCSAGQGNPDSSGDPSLLGNFLCEATSAIKVLQDKFKVNPGMDREPVWQEPAAYRSYRSGHSIAARELEQLGEGICVTFLPFACSGAEIVIDEDERALGKRAGVPHHVDWPVLDQVKAVRAAVGTRKVDALVITVGANDVGFGPQLSNLTTEKFSLLFGLFKGGATRPEVIDHVTRQLEKLPGDFDTLAAEVRQLDPRHVFITEYPLAFFDKPNGEVGGGCGVFETTVFDLSSLEFNTIGINEADARTFKNFGQRLNDTIRDAARKHGWVYVDGIAAGFNGHGYCTGSHSFFVGAERSCKTQGDLEGTMHPNEKGHRVYADCLIRAIRPHLAPATGQPAGPAPSVVHPPS